MKTKLKRVSRSTLAVILAIMMVFSTMLVGTISVSAASYFTAGSTIYLDSSSCSWWVSNTTDALDAHFLNSSDNSVSASVQMSSVSGKIYSCTVPSSGSYDTIKFTRNSTHVSSPNDSVWNSTTTSVYDGSSNMWEFTNDTNPPSGQWSTYDTSQKYYVRGTGSGLSWDAGKELEMKNSDDGSYSWFEATGTYNYFRFFDRKNTFDSQYNIAGASTIRNTINGVATGVTITNSGSDNNCRISSAPSGTYYIYLFHENDTHYVTASTQFPPTQAVTVRTASVSVASGAPNGASAYVSSYTDQDGKTQSGSSTATFKDGTDVTFKAAAVSGYTIAWSGATGTASSDGTTFTVSNATADITVTATYTAATSTKEWNSVALIGGTLDGTSIGDWSTDSSYTFTYNAADDTWYSSEITFTGNQNDFKARVNTDWNKPSFGNGTVANNQEGNFTETLNGTYIFYVKDGASLGAGLQYKKVGSTTDKVTVMSKLNVTDGSGNPVLTATTDGTETSKELTGTTFTLTASDSKTNYNFAGWKLDGVTLTSGTTAGTTASKTISFTINSGAENPTVTATAITLTPRLDVSTTSLVLNGTKQESVTLHAYSKVGDKTKKAKYYTVTYYYDFTSEDGATTTTKNVADTKTITVTDDDYANMSDADATKYLIGGIKNVDYTFTPSERGTYVFYADIQGYDSEGGSLVTGEYAELSLGTSLGKDGGSATVTVTDGTFKLPIADSDDNRLFAYATTLADGETPNADAWVAADSNPNQSIYGNSEKTSGAVVAYPSIGSASANSFNIYLPSSASATEVVLYNNYTTSVTVTGSDSKTYTINKGEYKAVPYTSGSALSYTVSDNTKSLTVYRSTAEGALYLNNTADFSSNSAVTDKSVIDSRDNVPNMIKQLYSDKETGAVSGCSGATALGSNIDYVNIKKIKGRGNTTWNYTDKKSFNVTFSSNLAGTAFGTQFKFNGAKYSLLANYKDPSLARNEILYTLADEMGVTYSPNTAVIDLYMNGLYMGTYLMTEKIEVGKKELISDISDSLYKDDTTSANGFSFLMELDTNASAEDYSFSAEGGQALTIKEPEAGTDFTTKYIKARYEELIGALNDQTKTTEELNEIIDVESLAKFFLLNELAKNCDIGVSSTYFVYKYDSATGKGKFYASPVWDMDMTAANGDKKSTSDSVAAYTDYTGNWSYQNNGLNRVIKAAFNNSNVQAMARSIWTEQYGIKLIETINTLGSQAYSKIGSSYTMNFAKWSKPYGFNGGYGDNIQARTSLEPATYTATANAKYAVGSSKTYNEDAGQIEFVKDWLASRAAWLTKKYNTYYITGTALSDGWNGQDTLTQSSNGIYTYLLPSGTDVLFKICTDGGLEGNTEAFGDGVTSSNAYRDKYATSISMNAAIKNGTNLIDNSESVTSLSVDSNDNNITYTSSSSVYLIYNQKNNTVTLSDQISSTVEPTITLSRDADFDDSTVAEGLSVNMTATVTPLIIDGTAITGADKEYTVELFRDGVTKALKTETVTFADDETSKKVPLTTNLVGPNQTYYAKVSFTHESTSYTKTSNAVTYKKSGLKDQKIYFDPSTQYTGEGADKTQIWKSVMTTTSTVTATVSGTGITTETFTMSVDTEDIHGYDKGVFVADITAETLTKLQDSNNTITFALDGEDLTPALTTGNPNIKSGWIYNYSNQKDNGGNETQKLWEEYNTPTTPSYPHSDITTYAQFKEYLAAMNGVANEYSDYKNTDKIVYFDNSVSKWYNVYIYGWDDEGYTSTLPEKTKGIKMQKLPYADIWYYVFDSSTDLTKQKFLFKDRGDAGFGSDYQQTVDLVGTLKADGTPVSETSGFIMNGIPEKVYLNFEGTILRNPCPIFVTQSFYLSTIQNDEDLSDGLKYRAFNTEWQNFYTVVSNTVQTSAVNVYFDLHDASTVDNILLYHTSTATDQFKFPSEFTRLTKLPGSTIYYASILLPHTDTELKFTFDKFVIGSGDTAITKPMGDKAQPAFTCINTGEVWYEYAPTGISYETTPAEATVLSAKPADDTSSVGANETNDSVAANSYTIYAIPSNYSEFSDYVNSTTGEIENLPTNQKFVARVHYGSQDNSGGWASLEMTKDSRTIGGKAVYSITLSLNDSGLSGLYFKIANPSNDDDTSAYTTVFTTWTTYGKFSNKIWYNNSLTDPNWDSVSENKDLYLIGGNFNDWKDNYNYKEYKLAYNETSDTYSITVDIAKLKDYFAIHDTSKQYSSTGSDDTSNTNRFITALNEEKSLTESDVAFKYTGDETGDVVFNVSGDLKKVWLSSVTTPTPTPTIKITAENATLTLSNGSASTQLNVTTDNAGSPTLSYSVTKDGASVDANIASVNESTKVFTATESGTYEVTAKITVGGTDYTATVTITVNPASTGSTTEYCGVLGYNHSTATFASTEGGTITKAYVNLINGYQNNDANHPFKTGYTTVTDGVYTVIYALTSTGNKSDAETYNVGVTEKDSNKTENYTFNGWTKDGRALDITEMTMSNSVSSSVSVDYVANWSLVRDVTYTFTYKYDAFDTSSGYEYKADKGTIEKADYVIKINLPETATREEVERAYLSYVPKIQSNYFTYSFDNVNIEVSTEYHTAEAKATKTVKEYIITLNNTLVITKYFYQNIATYSNTPTSGKVTVWKDENGKVLYVGNTYKFRVTKDIAISYSEEDPSVTEPFTYVNDATYEFYTSGSTERVKFNILVDNYIGNTTVSEFGVIYFFTDSSGVPVDNTISYDVTVDEAKLVSAAQKHGNGALKVYNPNAVNNQNKYIFAPTLAFNDANKDRYLRVYSYFKDEAGNIVLSKNYVLASIRTALT